MANAVLRLRKLTGQSCVGVKGAQAAEWLEARGVATPRDVYGVCSYGDGGLVIRQGGADFLVQFADGDSTFVGLCRRPADAPSGVYPIPRCDAVFEVTGTPVAVFGVFAQTCGVDLQRQRTDRVLFSRVAGVSCCILPERTPSDCRVRLWLDPTFADYLWHELEQIVGELGGSATGPRSAVSH